MNAHERIEQLADPGSFKETDRFFSAADPLHFADDKTYPERLKSAREKTGLRDAVVTGHCRIGGYPALLAVLDFEFMGGSMGSVVGEKIARAFERATREDTPIVTVATSGGARMQEGMISLLQMAKTASAATRLRERGVPFISVLSNPTTGGIYASFANLGDVILAEPGALIGFAGPRVIEQTMGAPLPPGSHTAEFLLEHGMIDAVVEPARLKSVLTALLSCLADEFRRELTDEVRKDQPAPPSGGRSWDLVQLARRDDRPTSLDYIERVFDDFVELHGDRLFGDDPALVMGFAKLAGRSVVVMGQERGHGDPRRRGGRMLPEGYRKAQRAMRLAEKFRLPLVSLLDTPGAMPTYEAEERGLAMSLATCLSLMSDLRTPTVAVVVGEGGSGGALALGACDRVLMQENSIYSVIAPEGAAAILYRDAGRAEDISDQLKLTPHDLMELHIVDGVVPEPEGGAHTDPESASRELRDALVREVAELDALSLKKLVRQRYERYRSVGAYSSALKEMMLEEARDLTSGVADLFQEGWRAARGRFLRGEAAEVVEPTPAGEPPAAGEPPPAVEA